MKTLLATLALIVTQTALASEPILNCQVDGQGKAQIAVLDVTGHPEMKLLKVRMLVHIVDRATTGTVSKASNLSAVMAAQIERGQILASGMVENEGTRGTIINPELITLQGSIVPDENGLIYLQIIDSNRVLQRGYGMHLGCK